MQVFNLYPILFVSRRPRFKHEQVAAIVCSLEHANDSKKATSTKITDNKLNKTIKPKKNTLYPTLSIIDTIQSSTLIQP